VIALLLLGGIPLVFFNINLFHYSSKKKFKYCVEKGERRVFEECSLKYPLLFSLVRLLSQ